MFNKLFKKVTGFTLIELLVVMGVLAVLAAGLIAIINPADRVNLANDTKAQADLNQVLGAVLAYSANNSGLYPAPGTASSAAVGNFSAVGSLLVTSGDLTVSPVGISGYNYAYNCTTTACKLSVQLKSNKNKSGANFAAACWTAASGTVSIQTGATLGATMTANATCP